VGEFFGDRASACARAGQGAFPREAGARADGFCSVLQREFSEALGVRREGCPPARAEPDRSRQPRAKAHEGGPLLGLVAWRSKELAQKPQRIGLELNELQPYVEASDRAGWQALYPNHLGRVSNGRNIRKKELHLQQLADLEVVVAENADTAEADVDGLPLAGKELHPGGPAIERRTNATILSAVLIVFGHLERH
jgi:hypothetical protein